MDHEGRNAVGEALVDHEVPGVGQHGGVEPGDVSHEVIEASSGHPASGIHIHAVKPLHNLGVIGYLKVGSDRLAEPLDLHIGGVVRADGNGGVDHLGDEQHNPADLSGQLVLLLFQLRQAVGVGFHLGLGSLGLRQLGGVLLGLAHEHAHLLAKGVPGRAEVVRLGHGVPVAAV